MGKIVECSINSENQACAHKLENISWCEDDDYIYLQNYL